MVRQSISDGNNRSKKIGFYAENRVDEIVMNPKKMTQEQISALADGELDDRHINIAVAALRELERQSDWEIYHQIGDVLRSSDMAVALSSEFSVRMAARLKAEPPIIMPSVRNAAEVTKQLPRRWALSSMIAAASMATVAFVTTPQLMVAMKDKAALNEEMVASSTPPLIEQSVIAAGSVSGDVVLRDPRIDDYLLAHQQFSPSLYSTAQYARSATFSNK